MNTSVLSSPITAPSFKRDGATVYPSVRESLTQSLRQHPVRVIRRVTQLIALILFSAAEYLVTIKWTSRRRSLAARNHWMQHVVGRLLRVLNVEISWAGRPPQKGFIVSNHLSYLDILVLGSVLPLTFVAKSEIRDWPLLGWFIRQAGTRFVQRTRRLDVGRVVRELREATRQDVVISFFPEGTCTDGSTLLRFHSSLFAAPVREHRAINPVSLGYSLDDGSAADEVCYWSEISFGAHFLNLLSKRVTQARVIFGQPILPGNDRKKLAQETREAVAKLATQNPFREVKVSAANRVSRSHVGRGLLIDRMAEKPATLFSATQVKE